MITRSLHLIFKFEMFENSTTIKKKNVYDYFELNKYF